MTKAATSFRLEEEQIKQLNELVSYYKQRSAAEVNENFTVKVSKASVVELLIREKHNELVAQGSIQ